MCTALQVVRYFQRKVEASNYLSTWFCGADYRLIRRDNVAELLAYGFFYKSVPAMEQEGNGELLQGMVSSLEGVFGVELPQGYTPGLRGMFHLWEPLRAIYRCGGGVRRGKGVRGTCHQPQG